VNSIIVRCDLINNECAFPTDIIDCFTINASFGSNILYQPSYEKWISVKSGTYNTMTISFQDQNFTSLQCNDPNVLIALILRQGKKSIEKLVEKPIDTLVKEIAFKN
jgi:hypothetical protein